MCFHARQTKTTSYLEHRYNVLRESKRFEIEDTDIYYYHANGYSHPELFIIPQEEPTVLHPGIWGILPTNTTREQQNDYFKRAARFGGGLNAQSEKAFNHFLYKRSIFERRCLIPLDGFYEPHTLPNGKKIPFHFCRKDKESITMAGIYTVTSDGFVSFTIFTKQASPLFAKVHNSKERQPVLLNKEFEKDWLRDDLTESGIKELINIPYPDDELGAYAISKDLFSPKVDSNILGILEPVDYPELQTLF